MASLYGLAMGTARGGVPSARIAVYKVCWSDGCWDADILAAFDDAIADGVDIISISVGVSTPHDYFNDSIAIGAFHAMKYGILTSNSGGNGGPGLATISNISPWSLSVAASTIDRKFFYEGPTRKQQGLRVGAVMQDGGAKDVAYSFPLPLSYLGTGEGSHILSYMNSTSNATATIYKSNEVNDTSAPYVVSFSSRGPNAFTPDALKPDIAAPGVDILAAWSPLSSVTQIEGDNRMAINPGLVYDAGPIDYMKFLCGQGYNSSVLRMISGDNSSCSEAFNGTVWDLNSPSFALSTSRSEVNSRVFNRVVTNVGSPTSIYKSNVTAPPGLKIQVNPPFYHFPPWVKISLLHSQLKER
uniref:Peptidase S8/S53 domain-containing protein n=1 Tax=Populus alba TaxID=43335 RepID=A0A4U5QAL1_POPAL|nr:hypothetical protein D5086_0000128850 [Populus alba]